MDGDPKVGSELKVTETAFTNAIRTNRLPAAVWDENPVEGNDMLNGVVPEFEVPPLPTDCNSDILMRWLLIWRDLFA